MTVLCHGRTTLKLFYYKLNTQRKFTRPVHKKHIHPKFTDKNKQTTYFKRIAQTELRTAQFYLTLTVVHFTYTLVNISQVTVSILNTLCDYYKWNVRIFRVKATRNAVQSPVVKFGQLEQKLKSFNNKAEGLKVLSCVKFTYLYIRLKLEIGQGCTCHLKCR